VNTVGPSAVSQGNNTILQVSTGAFHTCAVTTSGMVMCWGAGTSGRLGDCGNTDQSVPVFVTKITNAVQVSVGESHACCLLRTGYVMCWGGGMFGQLGNNNTVIQNTPVNVVEISNAVHVSCGDTHSCAVLSTGGIMCWGRGDSGQLGNGMMSSTQSVPVAVSGITNGAQVAAGAYHTCAVLRTGAVSCWGQSSSGELGAAGLPSQQRTPFTVPGVSNAVQVSTGTQHTCALLTTGSIGCWGAGGSGQLGHGSAPATQTTPVNVTGITNALQVTAGDLYTCAVLTSGSAMCWGGGASGQLGTSYTLVSVSVPIAVMLPSANYVDAPGPVMNMSSGFAAESMCAITFDGRLKCWGYGGSGMLGTGTTVFAGTGANTMGNFLMSSNLGTGRSVRQVSSSNIHACAVLDNGNLKCWGSNTVGELGQGHVDALGDGSGEMGNYLPLVNLGTGRSAVQVSASTAFTCATLDDGSVKCFGQNTNGQLGQGDTTSRGSSPSHMGNSLPAVQLGTGRTTRTVTTGSGFACALLDNSQVKCWGYNTEGNLGLGDTSTRGAAANQMGNNLPYVQLGTGLSVQKIAGGAFHTCALLSNSKVKCWGVNSGGKLGIGSTTSMGGSTSHMGDNLPFAEVGTDRLVKDIFAGYHHTCAILDNNLVKCWGFTSYGQLGYGSSTDHKGDSANEMGNFLPYVNIGTGRTALHMSLNSFSTCALLDNYALKCWGRND
jgi:alpha-tubulin suppressor-like RCC1 family protein